MAKAADRPVAWSIAGCFSREAQKADAAAERRAELELLASVLCMSAGFHPEDAAQPYGRPGGVYSPEHTITPEQAAELSTVAGEVQTPEIRALFADVAWLRIRGNADIARLAVAAYVESARILEDPKNWSEGLNRAERALRLGRSLGSEDAAFEVAVRYLNELVDRYQGNDPLFLTARAIELLFEFEIGDEADFIPHVQRGVASGKAAKNYYVVHAYLDLLVKIYRRLGDTDASDNAARDIAKAFESEARDHEAGGRNMVAAKFYTQAIQAHRKVKNSAPHVEALRQDLQRTELASISEFKTIPGQSIDVSDIMLAARRHVTGKPWREALLHFAFVSTFADAQKMRQSAVQSVKEFPLHRMMGTSYLDGEGRTVGIARPVDPDTSDEAIFPDIFLQMDVRRRFAVEASILPALDQLCREHPIALRELIEFCAYSAFVPPGREEVFAKGLLAGFTGDFLTACHLLIPQIENSLRHLMQQRGIVTTKLDRFDLQKQLDLNELVIDERIASITSAGIQLELRTLLTDNRGPNLRNQLAHGMLTDEAFRSVQAVYAWWLVLALCMSIRPVTDDPAPSSDGDSGNAPDSPAG